MQYNRMYLYVAVIAVLLFLGGHSRMTFAAEKKEATKKAEKKTAAGSDILVSVNGVKLKKSEVDGEITSQMKAIKKQISPEQMEKLQGQIEQMRDKIEEQKINQFIERVVIGQEADKKNITVSDNETDDVIKNYSKQIPSGMTLDSVLAMQGMNMKKLKDEITFSLRAKKLIESQVTDGGPVTAEEVKQYYESNKEKFDEPESVHARHILLKAGEADNETVKAEMKKKIDAIRKQLTDGADFEKVAKEASDCPSKGKGGDLGTFTRGRMVKQFEDAAFGQKINEIGPVVQTQFGYHIIQVLEHNDASSKSFADVKTNIEETLKNKKKNEAIQDYIDGLKKKATIVYGKG